MAKVGVILSGCGVYDGAEIHESVLTLLYLYQNGAEVVVLAPDIRQHHVINHQTGEVMNESRNVLVESARIARGNVLSLLKANPADYDAIILPGGFGAAKNLSSFAFEGQNAKIEPSVLNFLRQFKKLSKPIGAMCIAPALLALLRQTEEIPSACLTIGSDPGTAQTIEACGCVHEIRNVNEISVDSTNLLVTTPAYMLGKNPAEIALGIEKLVIQILSMIAK